MREETIAKKFNDIEVIEIDMSTVSVGKVDMKKPAQFVLPSNEVIVPIKKYKKPPIDLTLPRPTKEWRTEFPSKEERIELNKRSIEQRKAQMEREKRIKRRKFV